VPYRKDLDVLRSREADLERELATLSAKEEELRALKANESDLRSELADVRAKLEPWKGDAAADRGRAPAELRVDDLRIASPCSASWDDMVGDDKRRFCDECGHSVYNASALTRAELDVLLGSHAYQLCLRMYRREDGTVMTADCPVGKRRVRLKQVAKVACGSVLAGVAVAMAAHELQKPKLEDLYSVHMEGPTPHHRLMEHADSVLKHDPPEVWRDSPQVETKPTVTRPSAPEPRHTLGVIMPGPRSKAACDTSGKKYAL
jgi:hypothetical protein